jgi:hypothetical protein
MREVRVGFAWYENQAQSRLQSAGSIRYTLSLRSFQLFDGVAVSQCLVLRLVRHQSSRPSWRGRRNWFHIAFELAFHRSEPQNSCMQISV